MVLVSIAIDCQINELYGVKATLDMNSLGCSGAPTDCDPGMIVAHDLSVLSCSPTTRSAGLALGERLTRTEIINLGRLQERRPEVRQASLRSEQGKVERINLPDILTKRDTWIQSAIWSKEGVELLASDVSSGSILQFIIPHGLVREIKISSLSDGAGFRPTTMQAQGAGYVVESGEGHVFWMGDDLALADDLLVGSIDADQGFIASSAWSWIYSSDSLFVFGDRGKIGDKDSWSASLMRFSRHNASSFDTFTSRDLKDTSRQFARLGFPILASVQGSAYILLIDDVARIYRVGKEMTPLKSFPAGYGHVPEMPEIWSLEGMSALYAKMVDAQTVAGIYGEGEFLYLLTRRPDLASRTTAWNLVKIDPLRDALVYSKRLPVDSPHLVLVPGHARWAAIEKGPVTVPGKQSVLGIVLFSPDDLTGVNDVVESRATVNRGHGSSSVPGKELGASPSAN